MRVHVSAVARRPAFLVAIIGTLMLLVGLGIGLAVGSGAGHSAQAAGMRGGLDIFPDGSLVACTPTLGCTSHPAGTCTFDGASGAATCNFELVSHSGGAIEQNGSAECFFIQPSGSYFTSFNSHIVYSPSGEVNLRCAR